MSGVIKDSCHVSTAESIGNHCQFVSKIDLLPDLNVVNSETNSTVENGADEFIEYLKNLRIETSGNLSFEHKFYQKKTRYVIIYDRE